jgi:membrane-bound serine protease (ClpP class)
MFHHPPASLAGLLRVFIVLLLLACWLPAAAAPPRLTLLTIDGAIGPASADYVARGIARAAQDGSALVVLQIDTPGGLDTSMRTVIKAILSSPVPVAAYVAPSGARAASAGTYIVYASHLAAMAPGTNLGAATPVQLGGAPAPPRERGQPDRKAEADKQEPDKPGADPMTRKEVNDAAAYLRGLAQMRGRNAEWAERAVREALSVPAEEALKLKAIELLAPDVPALAALADGRTVNVLGIDRRLQTAGAAIVNARPDWRADALGVIANPSIALILMTLGIYGLLFEFMSPGAVAPGVIGALCLLLGLYGLQLLPVNYAGLALIFLGMAFFVAEAFMPSFGVLGLGGVAAFVTGALILIDTDVPGFGIPRVLVGTVAVLCALLVVATAGVALRTRRRTVVSGAGQLVGRIAEVLDDAPREGWANVGGETWRVVSDAPLRRAQKVRVVARKGPLLEVVATESQGD